MAYILPCHVFRPYLEPSHEGSKAIKGVFQQHTSQSAEVPEGSAVTSGYHALYLALQSVTLSQWVVGSL